ncbi:hypothetical protein SAMN05216189_10479 [Pseudomonas delhiensis]|uniref:Uncharacterized protein n=1 Tax=Pseudomonas delhiensis TaxID=366289 RepID=A0A239NCC1_9PSED|nr:hypothetical protein [Pseudomonas delhiensis]SDK67815.1 hypothetical protein SAMN05216189_10479 [Pseudomonas delhiensis]SNT52566.1 hypothetical protein SAMN06295949_1429 [Pseudomonas delhiensis]
MRTAADRAEELVKRIGAQAKEASAGGAKEAFGLATAAILSGQLIKALERIERLEGDIKLLTELLASVENKR